MGLKNKDILQNWNKYYAKLENCFRIYGHTNLPEQWPVDQSLADWVLKVRKERSILSKSRCAQLSRLEFLPYKQWAWEMMYKELQAFQKKHGHSRIPFVDPEYKKLYTWLDHQKRHKDHLSPDQLKRLLKLGVVWDRSLYNEEKWHQYYKELLAYKRRFGDSNVPCNWEKNPQLGKWVGRQRMLKKQKKLRMAREKELRQIGFLWSLPDSELRKKYEDKKWEKQYRQLQAYHRRYGHTNVPHQWKENPVLARWVAHLRDRKDNLSEVRLQKLQDIGFIWNPLEAHWMERYLELKKYVEKHGHLKLSNKNRDIRNLGKWVSYQRSCWAKLSPDKKSLLKKLGVENTKVKRVVRDWMEMYKEVVAYKKKHGHIQISSRLNPKLRKWLYDQRIERVPHTPVRRELLGKIGVF